jgi:hypothetical protein
MGKTMKPILRVGVLNNFNGTNCEVRQLKQYEEKYDIFVNSNAMGVIRSEYPSFVTINPYLDKFVEPQGDIGNIKAVRVKYVSGANPIVEDAFNKSLEWAKSKSIPVLITFMRFRSKEQLIKYTEDQSNYVWAGNYYRQKVLNTWVDPNIHYCDLKKEGCPSCGNCAKLSYGREAEVSSIDLSSSGECKYNCPSCFAKNLTRFGHKFDNVKQNAKQKGMKHE